MVLHIHTSDSCNTLVSLDNNHDARSKELQGDLLVSGFGAPSSVVEYRKTSLLLPEDSYDLSRSTSCTSLDSSYGCYSSSTAEQEQRPSLHLPTLHSTTSVDEYLQGIPALRESCDELLAVEPHRFTEKSPEKLLYVHQGEVAHALASQTDILLSDRATTCHILAVRSTCDESEAMTSLTHLDCDQYEASVRAMIQEHKLHHGVSSTIEMEVNILGGFSDEEGHSQHISNWLLNLLADIADEEAASLQMCLKTCAISAMNDNGFQCPMGRGMAIHLATGQVFLAKASALVAGPHMILRNARLWATPAEEQVQAPASQLTVVHKTTCDEIVIEPFGFAALPGMDKLMFLPDEVLLQYTSTSPRVEEDDFCPTVRQTLSFLLEVPCANIFGRLGDRSLRFVRRHPHSNEWLLMTTTA